jgi:hypothetical protein
VGKSVDNFYVLRQPHFCSVAVIQTFLSANFAEWKGISEQIFYVNILCTQTNSKHPCQASTDQVMQLLA